MADGYQHRKSLTHLRDVVVKMLRFTLGVPYHKAIAIAQELIRTYGSYVLVSSIRVEMLACINSNFHARNAGRALPARCDYGIASLSPVEIVILLKYWMGILGNSTCLSGFLDEEIAARDAANNKVAGEETWSEAYVLSQNERFMRLIKALMGIEGGLDALRQIFAVEEDGKLKMAFADGVMWLVWKSY